jgi:hypothetical protein
MVIGGYLFKDSVTFRAPVLGGGFDVIGRIGTVTADTDGDRVELEFLGT